MRNRAQDAKLVPPAAGTMGYISPEQYGSNTISPAVDVWAMGCIMYEMLHAFSPFMPHEVMSPTVTVQFLEDESWGIVVGSDCRYLSPPIPEKHPLCPGSQNDQPSV